MTRDEIQQRVLEGIQDDPDTPIFFSETQLARLINEAYEVLAEDSQAIKRTAFVPLKEGVGFYSTPSISADFMAPTRIWNHSLNQRLTCLSMAEMDSLDTRWQTTTGTPQVWFPVSWDMFGIYPRPSTAGGVLRVDYIAWPRSLMDGSDRPELPEASHDALTLYGQYMGCLKKWDAQSAMIPLASLQKHKAVATARSGISRISVRSFQRSQTPGDMPHALYSR